MTLKKGATFQVSPKLSTSETFPSRVPSLRRSNTIVDDVVGAHRRRVALTLDTIDRSLLSTSTGNDSPQLSLIANITKSLRDTSFPIALGILNHTVDTTMTQSKDQETERRVLRPRHNRRSSRHHASDSGLGTSVASSSDKKGTGADVASSGSVSGTAVTRSALTSSEVDKLPGLGTKATNRIQEHILKPLLAKPSLKDFHPIVLECPRRMQEKEILCLRDLEKTLLLTAPVSKLQKASGVWRDTYRSLLLKSRSKSSGLYIDFCVTTINLLQATVQYFSDHEQTRPHDRPYTNGYFIDLVEQIHQYARQLADAKEREDDDEDDEMEVDRYDNNSLLSLQPGAAANILCSDDEVKLYGGINVNGQPAELIRVKKDGTAISMKTGMPIEDYEDDDRSHVTFKRSLSEQAEDEEEIMRSMARRKKNATAAELAPKRCREPGCNKEFKRPCDLTKHEKTHSRPWKCPHSSCKYHDYGWPTEKEMDRHNNDKHSNAPPMFECWYKPCPYKSKRESNCKQHMEKAHGWHYVRTKTNGKKSGSKPGTAEPTPIIGNLPTPKSGELSGVATPPEDFPGFPAFHSMPSAFPTYPVDDAFNPLLLPTNQVFPDDITDIHVDYSPMNTPSTESPSSAHDVGYSAYQNVDAGSDINEDIYGAVARIPEVRDAAAIFGAVAKATLMQQPFSAATTYDASPARYDAHISPIGEGNLMLFTPKSISLDDEGFGDESFGMGGDFVLFGGEDAVAKVQQHPAATFDHMAPSLAAGYSQPNSQDLYRTGMEWAAEYSYSDH